MKEDRFKTLADACLDAVAKNIAELQVERARNAEQHRANMAEIDARFVALEKSVKPRHRAKATGDRT